MAHHPFDRASTTRGDHSRAMKAAFGAICAAACVVPATATASTANVNVRGSILTYAAEKGGTSTLIISGEAGSLNLSDAGRGNILEAGEGCKQITEASVDCDSPVDEAIVDLGDDDGIDSVTAEGAHGLRFTINGGTGTDRIAGGDREDTLDGGPGNDVLVGGDGDDTLLGGSEDAGSDRLEGGPGSDLLDGGPGIDRAVYAASREALAITIGDGPNDTDGTGSTKEDVTDTVESITGGEADDVIIGSCLPNTLAGQGGNDLLLGDPERCEVYGGDFLGGGPGDDVMRGLGGSDKVTYTSNTAEQPIDVSLNGKPDDKDGLGGNDDIGTDVELVFGGAGDDVIDASSAEAGVSLAGRAGDDTLIGSPFDDYLRGELGADSLDCGEGKNDMYDEDREDREVRNCETPG